MKGNVEKKRKGNVRSVETPISRVLSHDFKMKVFQMVLLYMIESYFQLYQKLNSYANQLIL